MLDRNRFTPSDRAAITGAHGAGAARGVFGELEFVADEGADLAVIYDTKGEVAFVVTRQALDGVYLLTRAWRVLAETDNLKPVVQALRRRTRRPKAAKTAA